MCNIDIGVEQSGKLGGAHAGGIKHSQNQVVAQLYKVIAVVGSIEQFFHIGRAYHGREDFGHACRHKLERGIVVHVAALHHIAEKGPQSLYLAADGAGTRAIGREMRHP